ncbi:hypothetical protein J4573_19835 [Actinomadura barringtoniae]|uniref:Uncharacterized protein n=1 Tax=Actinomadura barringtoniae TaxID=1427535 RepID=A0A939T7J8_9ACTN|nr:hypothetical protein [Actinomadura barringtoniae]MBO2449362.1 hypothetical protein [Actinomadura barringtoniae]
MTRTAARALGLALIIFMSGLVGLPASAEPSCLVSTTSIAASSSGVEERQQEDRYAESAACPRSVIRAFRGSIGLLTKAARPIAVSAAALVEAFRRAGHGGRSPGAQLLVTLSVSRT